MINLMQFSLLKQEINTKIVSCKVQREFRNKERNVSELQANNNNHNNNDSIMYVDLWLILSLWLL